MEFSIIAILLNLSFIEAQHEHVEVSVLKPALFTARRVYIGISNVQCSLKCSINKEQCRFLRKIPAVDKKVSVCEIFSFDPTLTGNVKSMDSSTSDAGHYIFHHNYEDFTFVSGYEIPNYFTLAITYTLALSRITNVVNRAKRCQQHFWYKSFRASLADADWTSANGILNKFFPSKNDATGCYCSGTEACCCQNHSPACKSTAANDKNVWVTDEGYFSNKYYLPIIQLRFGDTGQLAESAYVSLGPLECFME